ncbi:MAG: hypothetical protein COA94_06685 [Rickettsiales bacterium]|nr:MAG: hypothetical protein COA94_06685 [Rickettsiales bacterium]
MQLPHDISHYKFWQQLASLPFLDKIYLYGSRARGDNLERSDIDLAICCPNAKKYDWQKLVYIIDNSDTLLKIDCVNLDNLNDDNQLKQNILKDGVVLYEK